MARSEKMILAIELKIFMPSVNVLLGCVVLSVLTNRGTAKRASKQARNRNGKAGFATYKDPFFGYSPPAEIGMVGVGDNKKMKIPAGFGLKYGQRRNRAGRIVNVNSGGTDRNIIGRRDGLEGDDDFVVNMDTAAHHNAAFYQSDVSLDNLVGDGINVMNAEQITAEENNPRGLDQAGGGDAGAGAGTGVSFLARLKDHFHENHDLEDTDLLANNIGALSASGIGGSRGGVSSWEKRQKEGHDQPNPVPVTPRQQEVVESEAPPLKQILDQMPLPEEPASYFEPSAAVAYVVPIASCPDDLVASLPPYDPARYQNVTHSDKAFRDAAAILQYSIAKVHARGGSRYEYQL